MTRGAADSLARHRAARAGKIRQFVTPEGVDLGIELMQGFDPSNLSYADPSGDLALRAEVAKYLRAARAVRRAITGTRRAASTSCDDSALNGCCP